MAKKKYIETPERLYEMWEEYKSDVKSNPRFRYVLCQRSGQMVPEPLERPLTQEGFEVFCSKTYGVSVEHYFRNNDNSYAEYCSICSRIIKERKDDQITGGMVGQYNPSITQRLNGLTEKQQIDTDGKIEVVFVKGKTIL
jgi:hypothetical protein